MRFILWKENFVRMMCYSGWLNYSDVANMPTAMVKSSFDGKQSARISLDIFPEDGFFY